MKLNALCIRPLGRVVYSLLQLTLVVMGERGEDCVVRRDGGTGGEKVRGYELPDGLEEKTRGGRAAVERKCN